MSPSTRIETDTFGPIDVPADKLWGAQTQRSIQNFRIGTDRMPLPLVHALAIVKQSAALVNKDLGKLEPRYLTTLREYGGLQSYPSRLKDPDTALGIAVKTFLDDDNVRDSRDQRAARLADFPGLLPVVARLALLAGLLAFGTRLLPIGPVPLRHGRCSGGGSKKNGEKKFTHEL